MKKSTGISLGMAGLLFGLASSSGFNAQAETIYKCLAGDKVNFTSAPKGGQNCRSVELNVVQPNPDEVARELEKQRLHDEAKEKEASKAQAERKQRDSEAALRRARTAEEAMLLLKESPPMLGNGRSRSWTGTYPHQGRGSLKRYTLQMPQEQAPEIIVPNPQDNPKKP